MLEDLGREQLIDIINKLQQENKELKEKLYENSNKHGLSQKTKVISNEEKLQTFMDLFKGRTDVYAKKWTSNKTGKTGYSPVCKNEFNIYKCDKPRIKCNECPNRELLPLLKILY